MASRVHKLQLVHSATSMTMFHFFIAMLFYLAIACVPYRDQRVAASRPPGDDGAGRHHFGGSRCAPFSVRLISTSCSKAAKAAYMCSTLRSQSSISTRELAPGSEWVLLVWVRSGVSRLRQPPRSTDLPGSPIGS